MNLDKTARATVKDIIYFPKIYKACELDTTNKQITSMSYTDGFRTSYNESEVEVIRNLIKTHIKENGGVVADFYMSSPDWSRGYLSAVYYNSQKYWIIGCIESFALDSLTALIICVFIM